MDSQSSQRREKASTPRARGSGKGDTNAGRRALSLVAKRSTWKGPARRDSQRKVSESRDHSAPTRPKRDWRSARVFKSPLRCLGTSAQIYETFKMFLGKKMVLNSPSSLKMLFLVLTKLSHVWFCSNLEFIKQFRTTRDILNLSNSLKNQNSWKFLKIEIY